MESVNRSGSIFHQLVTEHRQPTEIGIKAFRNIWHAIVAIFYKISDRFRILLIRLQLAVVLKFFRLFHGIRIHLDNADAIVHQPYCKAEPVVSCRLTAKNDLLLVISGCEIQHPVFCFQKSLVNCNNKLDTLR